MDISAVVTISALNLFYIFSDKELKTILDEDNIKLFITE